MSRDEVQRQVRRAYLVEGICGFGGWDSSMPEGLGSWECRREWPEVRAILLAHRLLPCWQPTCASIYSGLIAAIDGRDVPW